MTRRFAAILLMLCAFRTAYAQAPQKVTGGDERYKADILVVVAHPDDEAFFTPYVARAIYDMHKRVAVIFSTRGGSGGNQYSRERGPTLANAREMEAREACAKLGISNVWFLDGKDTATQDVLDSLSNWGHGATLERLVGLIRLTRPEVIFTQLPGVFIGENHGDHQATGLLVTEAFDLSGDPLMFPSQLAGPTKHYEWYLSNLEPWQPKKLYFASDAEDQKQFDGSGPRNLAVAKKAVLEAGFGFGDDPPDAIPRGYCANREDERRGSGKDDERPEDIVVVRTVDANFREIGGWR